MSAVTSQLVDGHAALHRQINAVHVAREKQSIIREPAWGGKHIMGFPQERHRLSFTLCVVVSLRLRGTLAERKKVAGTELYNTQVHYGCRSVLEAHCGGFSYGIEYVESK